jgi:HK97 family phage portal protein
VSSRKVSRPRRAARAVSRGLKRFTQMVFSRQQGLVWRFLPRTGFDYQAAVGDGLGSSVLMAPIRWICRNFPSAPLQVLDADNAPIEDHPMVNLLRRPTPHYSGKLLWMATLLSWCLDGNAYWIKVWNKAASSVLELWYVPHWMLKPVSPATATVPKPDDTKLGDDFISHYEYHVDGQVFAVRIEDVVHFRDGIDPREPRKGLSALGSLFREIFTDDEAANFSAALLKNLGIPGIIISPDGEHTPSPEDVEAVKDYVDEEFAGDRRGKPMTMSGPTKVQEFGFSPEQLTLKELRRIPEERVSAIYGVAAIVAGLGAGLDRSTFANFSEAREAAYEENIIPTQGLMSEELRHQLLPDFGEGWEQQEVAFDLSNVRVLQADRNKEAERVGTLYTKGVITRAEARGELRIDAGPEDEVYWVPIAGTLLGADERLVIGGVPSTGDEPKRRGRGAKALTKQADHAGAMIALYPPLEIASALAVADGEPTADLHLTLAYLGAAADLAETDRLEAIVEGFAASTAPLSGAVAGVGHFDTGPEPVTYASADVPNLAAVRERLVEVLARGGFEPSAEHGFTPHITLAYADVDPDLPSELPLEFTTLSLVLAGERSDFALTGTPPKRRFTRTVKRPASAASRKERASEADYERGLHVVTALRRDLAALEAVFAHELDQDLAVLGRTAADAYLNQAQPGLAARNGARKATSAEDAASAAGAAAAEWAEEHLRSRLETHWQRTADTTVQTINTVLDLGISIPDPVARALVRDGGTRLALLDVGESTRTAVMSAIADGREQGLGPEAIARQIRQLVPAGRFTDAGSAYRAKLIATTETLHAQRMSSLAAYRDAATVTAVIAYDNLSGFGDPECTERDGEVMSFDDAGSEAEDEHPNGTLSFGPLVASSVAEVEA